MKILAALLSLLSQLLTIWREKKVEDRVRQDVQEQLDANAAKAEEAVVTPDPVRDERLRNRFDRAHKG